MKRKRFTEEQIIGVLKEHEAGAKADEICRRHGISSATFYTWRKKYGGMEVSEAKRLRELEAENAKLKRIVADQMLDMSAMKDLLAKTGLDKDVREVIFSGPKGPDGRRAPGWRSMKRKAASGSRLGAVKSRALSRPSWASANWP